MVKINNSQIRYSQINESKIITILFFVLLFTSTFDIPIIQQFFGFICISFLPGFLIVRILKIEQDKIQNIILSLGLSLTFLMVVGLIYNDISLFLGIYKPFSSIFLIIIIISSISILIISYFLTYKKNVKYDIYFKNTKDIKSNILNKILFITILVSIPILAILGATFNDTNILLLMLCSIFFIVFISIFFPKIIEYSYFSLILFLLSFSIILQKELFSNYLIGWDIFGEFMVFKITMQNAFWNNTININDNNIQNFNSMLSITILPNIYTKIFNIKANYVFKLIYPFFYSLVPVSLYKAYKQEFGENISFLSAFYFILFPRFYIEERRQIIGEFFFILLISIILNKKKFSYNLSSFFYIESRK
jgi:uncharacterized membrane protein